jgi:LmbE family N-acetylglucosaminyl deacetylase
VDLALSPHNDDVELFAAYACMRFRPLVVVCLRSFVQEEVWDPPGATYQERELETAEAMEILGCPYMQFNMPDNDPDWGDLRNALEEMNKVIVPERVWAPLSEDGGHFHHNAVGEIAEQLWGDRVVFYATYTHTRGRTEIGARMVGDASEQQIKKHALSRYRSQIEDPRTSMHFSRPLDEFYLS